LLQLKKTGTQCSVITESDEQCAPLPSKWRMDSCNMKGERREDYPRQIRTCAISCHLIHHNHAN